MDTTGTLGDLRAAAERLQEEEERPDLGVHVVEIGEVEPLLVSVEVTERMAVQAPAFRPRLGRGTWRCGRARSPGGTA